MACSKREKTDVLSLSCDYIQDRSSNTGWNLLWGSRKGTNRQSVSIENLVVGHRNKSTEMEKSRRDCILLYRFLLILTYIHRWYDVRDFCNPTISSELIQTTVSEKATQLTIPTTRGHSLSLVLSLFEPEKKRGSERIY